MTLNGENGPENVEGLVEENSENGVKRGLNFKEFQDKDFGWWSCEITMNESPGDVKHLGTFRINKENEFPKDIRFNEEDIEVIQIEDYLNYNIHFI